MVLRQIGIAFLAALGAGIVTGRGSR